MKGLIALAGLALFLGLAFTTYRTLEDTREEQVVLGWANSLVWNALETPTTPNFESRVLRAGDGPGRWTVTGEVAYREGSGAALLKSFEATVEQTCGQDERRECWRLARLSLDGSEYDLTVAQAEQEPAVEGLEESVLPAAGQDASAEAESVASADGVEAESSTPEGLVAPATAVESADGNATGEAEAQGEQVAAAAVPTPAEVNGSPAGERPSDSRELVHAVQDALLVHAVQEALNAAGYNSGPADGKLGPRTSGAIATYQQSYGLVVDGKPSLELLLHIRGATQTN